MIRLDLINAWASGNKYYKLKYALAEAITRGYRVIISKGGMFSNHLAALAEACKLLDIHLIAVIRSHGADEMNPSIQSLRRSGADIHYVDPHSYHDFDEQSSRQLSPEAFFIPEGGLSKLGIKGAAEIAEVIHSSGVTHVIVPGGTLGTSLGICTALDPGVNVIIVPAWKGCTRKYVEDRLQEYDLKIACSVDVWADHHVGGFGKFNASLVEFMTTFSDATDIPLDPVYTGKMMYAFSDYLQQGYFKEDANIATIHTGGLQGLNGYRYRFPGEWSAYALRYAPR